MTSSTDPFPLLEELPLPVAGPFGGGSSGPDADGFDAARTRAVEAARRAGFEQGHADGWAVGAAEARAQVIEEFGQLLARLDAASQQLAEDRVVADVEMRDTAIDLALAIAEAVIGHEVTASKSPGEDALRRAIQAAGPVDGDRLVARMNPEDIALLDVARVQRDAASIQVVPDGTLDRGDCVLDTPSIRIDASIDAALQRVRAALDAPPPAEVPVAEPTTDEADLGP